MGSIGGVGPSGLPRHEIKTLFLRAPYSDWPALAQGRKTEFRTAPLGAISESVQAPTPVVLYTVSPRMEHRSEKLVVLLDHRVERLIDIADKPESLAREGFADYEEFKRYWRIRTRRPYRALAKVAVFQLGPFNESERERLGPLILDRLYREYHA